MMIINLLYYEAKNNSGNDAQRKERQAVGKIIENCNNLRFLLNFQKYPNSLIAKFRHHGQFC